MIDLTARAGCPLHLSHATMNFAPNKGRAGELLALLDAAIAAGADITLDTYPYLPGATTLSAMLPSWSSAGGQDETLRPAARSRGARAGSGRTSRSHGSDGCHGVVAEWDTIEISGVSHAELGDDGRADHRADRRRRGPRAVRRVRRHPGPRRARHRDPAARRARGERAGDHAATRGTPAAATGCWSAPSRTRGPGARSRATSATTAATWACSRSRSASGTSPGGPPRGCGCATAAWSAPGYAADLVLFDPDTVADTATYDEPRQPAAGIPYVFVNGELAIDDGRRTRRRPAGPCAGGRTERPATDLTCRTGCATTVRRAGRVPGTTSSHRPRSAGDWSDIRRARTVRLPSPPAGP